jgi:hypothetical protein
MLMLLPQIAGNRVVFQLHDSARLCAALSIKEFLSVHQITVLLHAPYSSDLSPYNFFLFPGLKRVLRGHQYNDTQAIQTAMTKQLSSIPASACQDNFKYLHKCWKWCTDEGGRFSKEILSTRVS